MFQGALGYDLHLKWLTRQLLPTIYSSIGIVAPLSHETGTYYPQHCIDIQELLFFLLKIEFIAHRHPTILRTKK